MDRHAQLEQIREQIRGSGFQWKIDNLPFTDQEKEIILEYLASRFTRALYQVEGNTMNDKWYDPLKIEGKVALSYAFELEDGGRRHAFRDLQHLEQMLTDEMARIIRLVASQGNDAD